jgi:hypothetical protein
VVWIFTRKATPGLTSLVRQLDSLAQEPSLNPLNVIVIFVGPEREALVASAAQIQTDLPTKKVIWAIPKRHAIGAPALKLHQDAEATVLIARQRQITSNHAVPADGMTEARDIQIMADVKTMLR